MSTRTSLLSLGVAIATAAVAVVALAASGGLDPSFGTGGVVIHVPDAAGNRTLNHLAAAVQADHRIVTVGLDNRTGVSKWAVRRYLENGALDTSFGAGGLVALFGTAGNNDCATDVTIDGAGRIYASGFVGRVVSVKKGVTTYAWDMAAVRLHPNGALDTSWGSGGMMVVSLSPGLGTHVRLALQPDGKLLLAGKHISGNNADGAVARLTSSGALDTSYGSSGKVVYSGVDEILTIALDPSGRLVAAGKIYDGSAWGQHYVFRVTGSGAVDTSFPKRNVRADFASSVSMARSRDIAAQSDGSVVLAGWGEFAGGAFDAMLVRYTPGGQPDTGFGTGGLVRSGLENAYPRGLAIQGNGRILLGVWSAPSGAPVRQTVARYLTNGSLDTNFGTAGFADNAVFDATITSLNIFDLVLGPSGRIVLSGAGVRPGAQPANSGGALVRYLGD